MKRSGNYIAVVGIGDYNEYVPEGYIGAVFRCPATGHDVHKLIILSMYKWGMNIEPKFLDNYKDWDFPDGHFAI